MDKLTKTQIKMLQTLRDNPKAKIVDYLYGSTRLVSSGVTGRAIAWESWQFIKVFLKEVGRDIHRNTHYTIREDAEISDAWRAQEEARRVAEYNAQQAAKEAAKEQARLESLAQFQDVAGVLSTEVCSGIEAWDGGVEFEYKGVKYTIQRDR